MRYGLKFLFIMLINNIILKVYADDDNENQYALVLCVELWKEDGQPPEYNNSYHRKNGSQYQECVTNQNEG